MSRLITNAETDVQALAIWFCGFENNNSCTGFSPDDWVLLKSKVMDQGYYDEAHSYYERAEDYDGSKGIALVRQAIEPMCKDREIEWYVWPVAVEPEPQIKPEKWGEFA